MYIQNPSTLAQAANQVVNQVFWGSMMREFRAAHQDPILGSCPGAGIFVQQLDQVILDRMNARGDSPLVKGLLRQLGAQGRTQIRSGQVLSGKSE